MRETRVAQASIFENYSKHEFGERLKTLSSILDQHPILLSLVAKDLVDEHAPRVGRTGLSAESVFRCLLLKQQLRISYEQLAFHLSDSMTYRTFARLPGHLSPSRSALQATIRSIKPETLEQIHGTLNQCLLAQGVLSMEQVRIDSTVVDSNIAPPSDSQSLNDGVRVLSRLLAKSKDVTGIKVRFVDHRKRSKSLSFQIFNAKSKEKNALYPDLLKLAKTVIGQADRGMKTVAEQARHSVKQQQWEDKIEHYKALISQVVDQTERRVINGESVPSAEKIVSLFEPHTDVIVKGFRDVQFGHKVNLSSEQSGFITHLSIEEGNPSDKDLFIPVLDFHQSTFDQVPGAVVADGGYASRANLTAGKALGIQRVVFHKPVGLSLTDMGVKAKTFKKLRHFRAGIEGNISELKRAFGASKAKWKGLEGFKAYVWSAALSYNLTRLARMNSG